MSKTEASGKSGNVTQSGQGKPQARNCGDGWDGWGGYMNAKKQKLSEQFANDGSRSDFPQIFRGIAIYVNGYTRPSSDELRRLLVLHGGQFEQYLYRRRVTHVIATNLPDSKIRTLKGLKVIRPEWITDSVREGRLLSYVPYQLYTSQTGSQRGLDNFARPANLSSIPDTSCRNLHPCDPGQKDRVAPDDASLFEESFGEKGGSVESEKVWDGHQDQSVLSEAPAPRNNRSVVSLPRRQLTTSSSNQNTKFHPPCRDSECLSNPSSLQRRQLGAQEDSSVTSQAKQPSVNQNLKGTRKKEIPPLLSMDEDEDSNDWCLQRGASMPDLLGEEPDGFPDSVQCPTSPERVPEKCPAISSHRLQKSARAAKTPDPPTLDLQEEHQPDSSPQLPLRCDASDAGEMPQCLSPSPELDSMPQLKAMAPQTTAELTDVMPDLSSDSETAQEMLRVMQELSPPPSPVKPSLSPNCSTPSKQKSASPRSGKNFSPSRSRPLFGMKSPKLLPTLTSEIPEKLPCMNRHEHSCKGDSFTSESILDPARTAVVCAAETWHSSSTLEAPDGIVAERSAVREAVHGPPELSLAEDVNGNESSKIRDEEKCDEESMPHFRSEVNASREHCSASSSLPESEAGVLHAGVAELDARKAGHPDGASTSLALDSILEEFQNDSDDSLAEVELGSQILNLTGENDARTKDCREGIVSGEISDSTHQSESNDCGRERNSECCRGLQAAEVSSALEPKPKQSVASLGLCAVSSAERFPVPGKLPSECRCDESPKKGSKGDLRDSDQTVNVSVRSSSDQSDVRELQSKETVPSESMSKPHLKYSENVCVNPISTSSPQLSGLSTRDCTNQPFVPPKRPSDQSVVKSKKESSSTNSVLPATDSSPEVEEQSCGMVPQPVAVQGLNVAAAQTQSKEDTSVQSVKTSSIAKSIPRTGDPKFLSEFYSNSRLHHISTWGAEYRAYVKQLQQQTSNFPGRAKLREIAAGRGDVTQSLGHQLSPLNASLQRVIMHIDMDCFFVSVSLLRFPHLKGKPVAVAHGQGRGSSESRPGSDPAYEAAWWRNRRGQARKRGRPQEGQQASTLDEEDDGIVRPTDEIDFVVTAETSREQFRSMSEIASCSYEARKAGVKNGMFLGRARALCPELAVIPYDFEGYQRVSKTLYDTVGRYTHDMEAVSCDELLVDCTDLLADTGVTALQFASVLREEIFQKTDCCASVGLGPSILVARMATRRAKPDGQFFVEPLAVAEFIRPQPIRDLPGVGWSTGRQLETMGVTTCKELQAVPLAALQRDFGPKTGEALYRFCRGQDDRAVRVNRERKSVSAEVNYGIRFTKAWEVEKFLEDLAEEVQRRLQQIKVKGKTVTLKLMVRRPDAPQETAKFLGHGICNHFSKSVTMPLATDDAAIIARECIGILKAQKFTASDLRGVGIQVHRLESATLGPTVSSRGLQSILNFAVPTAKMAASSLSSLSSSSLSPSSTQTSHRNVTAETRCPSSTASRTTGTVQDAVSKTDSVEKSSVGAKAGASARERIAATASSSHLSEESRAKHRRGETSTVPDASTVSSLSSSSSASAGVKSSSSTSSLQTSAPAAATHRNTSLQTSQRQQPGEEADGDVEEEEDLTEGGEGGGDEGGRAKELEWDENLEGPSTLLCANSRLLSDLSRPRRAKDELPPLPCLPSTPESEAPPPDFSVTAAPPSRGTTSTTSTTSGSTTASQRDSYSDFLPSPSQVDPAVLAELPPDIRRQVEEDLRQRRSSRTLRHRKPEAISSSQHGHSSQTLDSKHLAPDSAREAHTSPQPGCSAWSTETEPAPSSVESDARTAKRQREERVEALPSLSQLDPDCLSALPQNMQEELRAAYAARERSLRSDPKPPTLPVARPPAGQRSPSKGRSPKRFKRGSPQFKMPRGRPGRRKVHSPRKLHFQQQQPTLNQMLHKQSPAMDEVRGRLEFDSAPAFVDEDPHVPVSLSDREVLASDSAREDNSVSLCGAVTIGEVRSLLSLWLESSAGPLQDDVEVMTRYLGNLILDHNLEQVDLVLKALHRYVRRSEDQQWLVAFEKILADTQSLIFSVHGSHLHTPWLPAQ